MSGLPPSRSYKAGKRGRHKRASSPEVQKWNAEHLLPVQPSWMDASTYLKLAKLRGDL